MKMTPKCTLQIFPTIVRNSIRKLYTTSVVFAEKENTISTGCRFELNDTQKKLQNFARKFSREYILPVAADYDKSCKFPWPIFKKAWTCGLINGLIPAHCGGEGRSLFNECLIGEELSFACGGIANALTAPYVSQVPVIQAGTKEQQRKYLGRLLEEPLISAFCVTERGAGSDVSAIKTEAIKKGDEWILNGQKMWISGAGVANWYFVLARTDLDQKVPASRAFTCFIVEREWSGVILGRKELNMGLRAADNRGITFEDVRIPKENIFAGIGAGFKTVMKSCDTTRVLASMFATGLAQRCLHEATKYAIEHCIENNQDVASMLADMAIGVEIARLSWMKSAWEVDTGKRHSYSASIAKCYAGDIANKCACNAVKIFGLDGLNSEYPLEKLMRDAKTCQIFEGTSQIQRLIISQEVVANAKSLN